MSFAVMPLYTSDYLRDTQHLSCSEHGIYLKLLMHCWDKKGPVPLDERKIMGIVNARSGDEIEATRRVLGEFFVCMDDGHYNKRMSEEVDAAKRRSYLLSGAGKRSAESRKSNSRQRKRTLVEPRFNQGSAIVEGPTDMPADLLAQPSKKQKSPGKPAKDPAPDADQKPTTAETWKAYAEAYATRYGVAPVRNASVNAMLAMFQKRIGNAEAPAVAAFYVGHNAAFYVSRCHPVKIMLADSEKLRTEWATGRCVNGTQARRDEATEANPFLFLIKEARRGQ